MEVKIIVYLHFAAFCHKPIYLQHYETIVNYNYKERKQNKTKKQPDT
jgi:hypothetical protein